MNNAEKMKAITVWQPWASLLACGAKQYETRPWTTSYRGPIAIHAAALKMPQVLKKCFPMSEWEYHPDHRAKMKFLDAAAKGFGGVYTTEEILRFLDSLPTGAVIATAELVDVWHIVRNPGQGGGAHKIEAENQRGDCIIPPCMELALGNWTPGRYAWELANVKPIGHIPAKGQQGLWWWEPPAQERTWQDHIKNRFERIE